MSPPALLPPTTSSNCAPVENKNLVAGHTGQLFQHIPLVFFIFQSSLSVCIKRGYDYLKNKTNDGVVTDYNGNCNFDAVVLIWVCFSHNSSGKFVFIIYTLQLTRQYGILAVDSLKAGMSLNENIFKIVGVDLVDCRGLFVGEIAQNVLISSKNSINFNKRLGRCIKSNSSEASGPEFPCSIHGSEFSEI